jgi:CxC4 like cysteine cluster associated with KDZ transposases/Kyakuja-Dileera-Zisupton transposase
MINNRSSIAFEAVVVAPDPVTFEPGCNDTYEEDNMNNVMVSLVNCKTLQSVFSKFQIHIVPRDAVFAFKGYVVVVLFVRNFMDGPTVVSCCSVCPSSSHFLRFYSPENCSLMNSPDYDMCLHEKFALQHCCKNADVSFSQNALKILSRHLVEEQSQVTGFWSAGKLNFYRNEMFVHISSENLIGLFVRKGRGWLCTLCKSYSCLHKKTVARFPDYDPTADENDNDAIHPANDLLRHVVFSKNRYKLDDVVFWKDVMVRSGNFLSYMEQHFEKNNEGDFLIFPEQRFCTCGENLIFERKTKRCLVVGPVIILNVIIFQGFCSKTECSSCPTIHYDGKNQGLINFGDKMLFCAGVAKEYLNQYSTAGTAFFNWWRAKYTVLLDTMEMTDVLPLQKWLSELRSDVAQCIIGFAELLDYPENVLSCCQNPKKITMDGIVLSIKALRIPEFQEPWISEKVAFRAGSREDRTLCLSSQEESFARDIVAGKTCSKQMCLRMSRTKHSGLALVCEILLKMCPNSHVVHLADSLKKFTSCFVKKVNPAVRMVPAFLHDDVSQLMFFPELLSSSVFLRLMKYSPVLLRVIEVARQVGADGPIVEKTRKFIECLLKCAKNTYENVADLRVCDPIDNPEEFYSEFAPPHLSTIWATGHSFPAYPPKHKIADVCIQQEALVDTCNKTYHQKGACGAGLVPFWCLEHRKCLGWIMLESAESPRVIANALLTRFPDADVVMYDNGCRLHEYVLNRFPTAAKNMQFFIDSLHWVNHTACSEVYNPDNYRDQLGNMSSVLCEQKNSILKNLKKTAPHLHFRSFVALMFYAVAEINKLQEINNKK